MKLRCYLSRRKYTLIRHLLFQKYNEDTKRWDPLVFNGVELPTPASDKTLMKLKKAIFEEYGVECNATGSRVNVNYRKKLAHDLSVTIKIDGSFKVVDGKITDPAGNEPIVNNSVDACSIHKNMKQPATGYSFPNANLYPQQPVPHP